MLRILTGFFIGFVLTGALFLGPLRPTPSGAEDPPPVSGNETVTIDLSQVDIKLMLTEADNSIRTEETRQFYETLMDSYGLADFPVWGNTTITDESSLVQLLPDMERINNSAIIVPLVETGKRIRDPDIARFYYKLLRDAGWDIEPGGVP